MKRIIYTLTFVMFCSALVGPALAGNDAPQLISRYGAWKVYSFLDNNEKVCFMLSQPQKQQGKFGRRDQAFFFVTHWDEGDKNVVSISSGYAYKLDSPVTVKINDKTFRLFTQGEMAWTKDHVTDDAMVEAFQKGATMVVRGTSLRGTEITDTYSLKGSGEAYRVLVKACAKP